MEITKTYIGIDPGKNGAVVFLYYFENTLIEQCHIMPLIGKEIDVVKLTNIFRSYSESNIFCVLENVHAIYGAAASSTFNFGYGLGLIEGILTTLKIPYTKVQPKKWQSQMFEGIPLQTKPSSTGKTTQTDTKKMALIAVQRLFPIAKLTATDRCKIPHDGIVDALLMAEYARRNF